MLIDVIAEGDGYVKMLGTYTRVMFKHTFKDAEVLRMKRWDVFATITIVIKDRSTYEGYIIKE